MNKGYVENGFIVDLANSKKTSEIIYELSKILDMPEAKNKKICLKLGSLDLSESELVSIKALIETMDSEIEFISTTSDITTTSAQEIGIEISQLNTTVPALDISATEEVNQSINEELLVALDKIFGEEDFKERFSKADEKPVEASTTEELKEDEVSTESKTENKDSDVIEADIQVIAEEEIDDLEELKKHDRETEHLPTLYIHRTLRSGQSIKSEGNIVIIGDVNPGAEVIAKGDITVWGILAGIANAGSDGNTYSKIRALKLNAIQIRIGNVFARRPDTVNTPYIHRTDSYIPEEARVNRNHIVIYKLHEA